MVTRTARVVNEFGIHCRPSAIIAREVQGCGCAVRVRCEHGQEADARSILELIGLAITRGQYVTIEVDGPEEERAAGRLVALFETNFDFPR